MYHTSVASMVHHWFNRTTGSGKGGGYADLARDAGGAPRLPRAQDPADLRGGRAARGLRLRAPDARPRGRRAGPRPADPTSWRRAAPGDPLRALARRPPRDRGKRADG